MGGKDSWSLYLPRRLSSAGARLLPLALVVLPASAGRVDCHLDAVFETIESAGGHIDARD